MVKLLCPICAWLPPIYCETTQQQINTHLLLIHDHKVTHETEEWYRKCQTEKWLSRTTDLDTIRNRDSTEVTREFFAFMRSGKGEIPKPGLNDSQWQDYVQLKRVMDDAQELGEVPEGIWIDGMGFVTTFLPKIWIKGMGFVKTLDSDREDDATPSPQPKNQRRGKGERVGPTPKDDQKNCKNSCKKCKAKACSCKAKDRLLLARIRDDAARNSVATSCWRSTSAKRKERRRISFEKWNRARIAVMSGPASQHIRPEWSGHRCEGCQDREEHKRSSHAKKAGFDPTARIGVALI